MAKGLNFEIPITVSEKGGKTNIGDKIAAQIKSSLGAIGIGKTGGAAAGISGKTGFKMAGILGAILAVLNSVSFIIKPVMSLLKAILMLLFVPLIPLLKPVLVLLQKFMEGQKKARDSALQIGKVEDPLVNAAITIANWALMVGAMIGEFLYFLGKGAFDLGVRIGEWLYEKVIVPAGEFIANIIIKIGDFIYNTLMKGIGFLKDIGLWIWTKILEPAWNFLKDVGSWIWDIIKTPFQWLADKVRGIVDWFGNLGGRVKGILGFAQGGVVPGATGVPQLAVVHGGEEVIPVGGRAGGGIIININNPIVRQSSDIKALANEVSRVLQRKVTGRITQ